MRQLLVLILLFASTSSFAQTYPSVSSTTKRADERAIAYLLAEKNDSAIVLYNTWLAANPRDNSSWYNLACAHAKSGHAEQAIACLQNAVRTGFDSRSTLAEDPDIALIRNTKGYIASLMILDSITASKTFANMERRYLPSRSVGTYRVLLPSDYATSKKSYRFCLLIPGAGWTEPESGKLAEDFGRDGVIYLIPRPHYPNFGTTAQSGSDVYFASWPDDLPGSSPVHDSVTSGYLNFLADVIADARSAYRIEPGPGIVIGQSQGASFADLFALHHPELVAAYVAHAAPYPRKIFVTDAALDAMKSRGVKATLVHSTEDNNIPIEHSKRMQTALKDHGITVELIETKGGHNPAKETRARIRRWLDQYRK
jgi:predicted esterase